MLYIDYETVGPAAMDISGSCLRGDRKVYDRVMTRSLAACRRAICMLISPRTGSIIQA